MLLRDAIVYGMLSDMEERRKTRLISSCAFEKTYMVEDYYIVKIYYGIHQTKLCEVRLKDNSYVLYHCPNREGITPEEVVKYILKNR